MSKAQISPQLLIGVWSATPSPLTKGLSIDVHSAQRMVEHHFQMGVRGLFLIGTCGEGPWMPDREKRVLVQTVATQTKGRMVIAAQVTDNSVDRVLDNIHAVQRDGADIAIIAPPYFLLNATPDNVLHFYQTAIRKSPLPVGLYHIIRPGFTIPDAVLKKILTEKNLVMVKDSSSREDQRRIMVAAKHARPKLVLLTGDEFQCVDYIQAGYDGLLLGGAILTARMGQSLTEAVQRGDLAEGRKIERRMHQILYTVYGGKKIACWLSGLKWTLVQMKVFESWSNFLNYPLTPACMRGIRKVLQKHGDVLKFEQS